MAASTLRVQLTHQDAEAHYLAEPIELRDVHCCWRGAASGFQQDGVAG